ncbi:SDR family NAD(P)-dependent oxidoreductase [Corallococcus praedator]|uniref:SDR family NAD(P)-dependent oxidoreductase n=1 Tax=Corallococcus praedator TaxID=2316724 RepID=A0ABX9QN02_9BACT|nr:MULTISPECIES: NAD-dependent epimerase/dehydratase family protein [Corallococcus]RKH27855.1 SDR family NAD(P)-dependent oxidoreductase [Corallococcus sp. CA031C]RKI11759.1 SDR family NAD(P)-dependent oxidoreductase [Corallococcus praedator]
MTAPLVLLGCGYTLTRFARVEARSGREVLATTRDAARRAVLEGAGVRVLSLDEALARVEGAHVVDSVPPEAGLDAHFADVLSRARPSRLVYLSSTGVYGSARGHVDELTPVDTASSVARARLEAEARFLPLGASVMRIAGIYGPGRGTSGRLKAGTLRIPESGGGRLSRIHVDDLVDAVRVVLERGAPGEVYCVADRRPATQEETATWLCQHLSLPMPPRVPFASLHESLRGDRAISGAKLEALGWTPRYPDFTTGFVAAMEEEARG